MDERSLRALIGDVADGRLSRRRFVSTMAGLGLSAPMAAEMLASAGVASAQPREAAPTPTRRGGGGDIKILMWDAPGLLNPHFGRGLKDLTASRLFYEPLAAPGPDGELVPILAEELPSRSGGVSKDGKSVVWRLKKNVSWHDGRPFTADDVVFNWEFAIDPATASTSRGPFQEVAQVEKLDANTVKVVYKKPQPYWGVAFGGGSLIPKHVFAPHKGASAREAAGTLKPVGTGPYKLVDFTPGDLIRAEINLAYHLPNRPFFDRVEIKGGGDAVSAARAVLQTGEYDFAYYVLAEEDVLKRLEQGGTKGRILAVPSGGVNHIQCNQSDPWREVDGERSSVKAPHPFLSDHIVRKAFALLVDRAAIQEYITGRNGQIASNFLNAPDRFRSRSTSWDFSVEKANQLLDEAGWARGPDGIRAKDGKRLKVVFQAATNTSVQKIQMVVKQAAARAGIEVEVKSIPASVFFSADPSNTDTNVRFLADLQMFTTFTGLDPQFFMAQFCSWEVASRENKWTGRNISRWQSPEYDRLWREAETEMDPVKRAALFIQMNDLVVKSRVVIPITWRNVVHAVSNQIGGVQPNSWDSILGSIAYWYRQG